MKNENEVRRFWNDVYGILLKNGQSVGDLAKNIGVTYNIIPNWKSKNRYPQLNYIPAMADFLKVSLERLLTGSEVKRITTADKVYSYLKENMPGLLHDVLSKVEKNDGSSGIKVS